jgi:hypothetical protein
MRIASSDRQTSASGENEKVVARFTDSDLISSASDFSASINWGDDTSSPGIVSGSNGSFTVSGTHSYAVAGKLPIRVPLSDTDHRFVLHQGARPVLIVDAGLMISARADPTPWLGM